MRNLRLTTRRLGDRYLIQDSPNSPVRERRPFRLLGIHGDTPRHSVFQRLPLIWTALTSPTA